ncbi:hypothetical protein JCM1840_006199 [Sporobolomyces johnsonii]
MPALRPATCLLLSVSALLLAVLLSGTGVRAQGLTTYTDYKQVPHLPFEPSVAGVLHSTRRQEAARGGLANRSFRPFFCSGATVTTSLTPTVYTTDGATLTFTATTPTTPVPSVPSSGSVMNIRDYMASQSAAGNAGAQKANFVDNNLKVDAAQRQQNGSWNGRRRPPLAVVVPVVTALVGSAVWLM